VYWLIVVAPAVGRGRAHRGQRRIVRRRPVSSKGKFFGTLIRHESSQGGCGRAPPRNVRALVIAVVLATGLACLVASIRCTASAQAPAGATNSTAVDLAPVVPGTHEERRPATGAAKLK
jgi:hypothetical protein